MRANLTIISAIILAVMLIGLGCEPEPKTTAEPPQQKVAEQVEPHQQQDQPSQQEIDRANAELEMFVEQQETKQVAEPEMPQQVEPQPVQPMPSPDDVIVTVNGTQITRAQVNELAEPRIEQIKARAGNRAIPPDYLANVEKRIKQQAAEGLIIETLVAGQMKKHNVLVTEQQIDDYITQMAARENMTVEDLKAIVTAKGVTYEQWKKQMNFDKIIAVMQLAGLEGLGTVDANEADARAFYEENKASYEKPEEVKASHILIAPDTSAGVDPNVADADAKTKAEELLRQIKDGADFAQLAMGNSACPSSANGGDLGFGTRQAWVGPFADAAFALQPGQVSDVVKTRFGYHIIKVTDRHQAGLTSFDEAKEEIIGMLRARRESEIGSNYIKLIRGNADIVYAPGEEPEQNPVQPQ